MIFKGSRSENIRNRFEPCCVVLACVADDTFLITENEEMLGIMVSTLVSLKMKQIGYKCF